MARLLPIALAALLWAGILAVRRLRAQALAALRAGWGQPATGQRRMDAMAASHESRLAHVESRASLDARTWADLNLDAVFAALDRTSSTLGQHALYHRLRTAPRADHLEAFDRLVTRFGTDAGARERAQIALSRLRDPLGYDLWWLGRQDAIDRRWWYVLFPCLSAATLLLLGTAPFAPSLLPLLVPVLLFNVLVRYLTDAQIGGVAAAFRQLAPVIATAEALRVVNDEDVRPLIGAIRADTPALGRLKLIARWISGDPLMLPADTGPLGSMVNDVVSVVYEYLNLALLLDANGVYFGGRALRARSAALLRVVAAIGEVDAAISVASFRAGVPVWTRPRFREPADPATLTEAMHPLLTAAVPNSITLAPGRGVLITGSNMSGKSTFLRTVGVTAVLAQTVHTCVAGSYEAPVYDVRSAIGRADDLLTGRSYYIAEVESLLALVSASGGAMPCLFLLDELFRGTNAVERIAAGQAILHHLVAGPARPNQHVVLAATHDGELVDLLADRYSAFHFGDAVGADGLIFDHRLRPGPAATRNAIALLRLHGAPVELIRDALACAERLDVQRGASLQGR